MIVTRRDLTLAQQAVQSTHAAIDFCFQYQDRAGPWHVSSNYLILLSVENELELSKLISDAQKKNIDYSAFIEPDLGYQLTAIALEPSPETQKLVSRIPLLFKNI